MKFKDHYAYKQKRNVFHGRSLDPIFVIGDVHGCADEFRILCEQIKSYSQYSLIIQAGDLIDRGPYFKEVFDVVREFNVELILGNHELNFLLEHRSFKKCNSKARAESHERFALLNEDEQESILSIMDQSFNNVSVHIDDKTYIISHSPIKQFEYNQNTVELNAWDCCSRNEPYSVDMNGTNFIGVHGHQHWNYTPIQDQIESNNSFINIDGGCVYGNELVAYELMSKTAFIVKANQIYCTSR